MSKDRKDEPTIVHRRFPKPQGNDNQTVVSQQEKHTARTIIMDGKHKAPWDDEPTVILPPLLMEHPQSGTIRARLTIEAERPNTDSPDREGDQPSQLLLTGAKLQTPKNTGVLKTLISSRTSGHIEVQEFFICGRSVSLSGWIRFVQLYEMERTTNPDGTPEGMNDFAYRQGFNNPKHPWFR